jgi:hypothetical protein
MHSVLSLVDVERLEPSTTVRPAALPVSRPALPVKRPNAPAAAAATPARAVAPDVSESSPARERWPADYFVIPPLPAGIEVVYPISPQQEQQQKQRQRQEEHQAHVAEQPERSEATKDGPESSRRRPRKSPLDANDSSTLARSSIPGMPQPQLQSPEPSKVGSAIATQPEGSARPEITVAGATRRKLDGPPPLLLGEFTADDVLLWLQTSAFKKRPPLASGRSGGREAYRSRIFDELRGLKARVAQTAVEMEA